MLLKSLLSKVLSGSSFYRSSDKHANLLWRIVPVGGVQLDIRKLTKRLSSVQYGIMFEVLGLERQQKDGGWKLVGALMSHQAVASDWVIAQQNSELANDS